jgi:hypothetical protein
MATNLQVIATVVGSSFLPEIIPAAVGLVPGENLQLIISLHANKFTQEIIHRVSLGKISLMSRQIRTLGRLLNSCLP